MVSLGGQMNNQPTPDTDAKASPHIGFFSCATVPAEFARKLERERDIAEDERISMAQQLESEKECHARCQNERDEAREEAQRFRSLSYARSGIDKSASWFPWETSLNLAQPKNTLNE